MPTEDQVDESKLFELSRDGDEEAFYRQVKEERDRRRICGLPPIYMALRLLGETQGVVAGYAQCPADDQRTSFVSVCGILLS